MLSVSPELWLSLGCDLIKGPNPPWYKGRWWAAASWVKAGYEHGATPSWWGQRQGAWLPSCGSGCHECGGQLPGPPVPTPAPSCAAPPALPLRATATALAAATANPPIVLFWALCAGLAARRHCCRPPQTGVRGGEWAGPFGVTRLVGQQASLRRGNLCKLLG